MWNCLCFLIGPKSTEHLLPSFLYYKLRAKKNPDSIKENTFLDEQFQSRQAKYAYLDRIISWVYFFFEKRNEWDTKNNLHNLNIFFVFESALHFLNELKRWKWCNLSHPKVEYSPCVLLKMFFFFLLNWLHELLLNMDVYLPFFLIFFSLCNIVKR
jgi:hypothetical protein